MVIAQGGRKMSLYYQEKEWVKSGLSRFKYLPQDISSNTHTIESGPHYVEFDFLGSQN